MTTIFIFILKIKLIIFVHVDSEQYNLTLKSQNCVNLIFYHLVVKIKRTFNSKFLCLEKTWTFGTNIKKIKETTFYLGHPKSVDGVVKIFIIKLPVLCQTLISLLDLSWLYISNLALSYLQSLCTITATT